MRPLGNRRTNGPESDSDTGTRRAHRSATTLFTVSCTVALRAPNVDAAVDQLAKLLVALAGVRSIRIDHALRGTINHADAVALARATSRIERFCTRSANGTGARMQAH